MTSQLRPECIASNEIPLSWDDALALVYKAVARRRCLALGVLDNGDGKYCALGCLWADHEVTVPTGFAAYIAGVNDAAPTVSPKRRWQRVMKFLRSELNL